MFGRTEEEKQAAEDERQRKAEEATKRAEAAAAAKTASDYAASPVGQAEAALKRGSRFFQFSMPASSLSGERSWYGSSSNSIVSARADDGPDVLTRIEDLGWRLEHASYVFVETGASTSQRFLSSGQGVVTEGTVQGVYLFRAAP